MANKTRNKVLFGLENDSSTTLFPPDLTFDRKSPEWLRTFSNPLALHVYTERYVNKGSYHSYRHYSEVTKKYRPLDGSQSFLMPYVTFPSDRVHVYEFMPSHSLKSAILKNNDVSFFIHPDMLGSYKDQNITEFSRNKIKGYVEVIPSSSTRTVFANIDNRLTMFKVDLSGKRLGRLTRHLKEKSIVRSNLVNKLLYEVLQSGKIPKEMAYFPETMGVGISIGENSYANLHREYSPLPFISEKRFIIPVFSLYSPDINNPGNSLIIQQLIRFSGMSPEDFFEKKIVRPMIYNAMFIAFRYGLLLEAHPQNTLVELDKDFQIMRFIYRDLQTVIIDSNTREHRGLITEFPQEARISGKWKSDQDQYADYSIFYDHRICYHTIEEIIIALATKYPCHLALLEEIVKTVFNQVMEELDVEKDKYFPKDFYYLYKDGIAENNFLEMKKFSNPPYR